jgi:TPR repeat protein
VKEAGDAGDGVALYAYGKKSKDGDGVTQDVTLTVHIDGIWRVKREMKYPQNCLEAFKWYKAALEKGSGEGARNCGVMLERGTKDTAEAVRCYKLAADAGHEL